MILSDASIRKELAAGRIVIDPLDERDIQPSSVDLRVDRYFRVFRNDTTPYIDPKQPQEDLTGLVEVAEGRAFILHPGEFVLGSTLERVALPDDLVARHERELGLGELAVDDVKVRPAHAAGEDAEDDLAGAGTRLVDVIEPQRLPRTMQAHRFHHGIQYPPLGSPKDVSVRRVRTATKHLKWRADN